MATLKEISELTGYSIATISRVLNHDVSLSVTDSTREEILRVAGKLDYESKSVRSSRKKAAQLRVGIIEMMDSQMKLEDPYYLYLKSSLDKCCFEEGFETVTLQFDEEENCYKSNSQSGLNGIIAVGQFGAEQIHAMEQWTNQIIFLDSSPYEDRFSSVVPNFQVGIQQGVNYLAEMGHKTIAFVGPVMSTDSMGSDAPEKRRKIFMEYMNYYRKDLKAVFIDTDRESSDVLEKTGAYLREEEHPATAFFAFNEAAAIGVMQAVQQMGYRVPEDFSILSYNDTVLATLMQPQLSSISIHLEEMAQEAVKLLRRGMVESGVPPMKIAIPSGLSERESVKRIPREDLPPTEDAEQCEGKSQADRQEKTEKIENTQ